MHSVKTLKMVEHGRLDLEPHGDFGFADVYLKAGSVLLPRPSEGRLDVLDLDGKGVATHGGHEGALAALVDQAHERAYVVTAAGQVCECPVHGGASQRTVQVGAHPAGVSLDPTRRHLFVTDEGDHKGRLVELKSMKVIGVVDLGGRPAASLYDDVNGRHYVALPEQRRVVTVGAPWGNLDVFDEAFAMPGDDRPLMLALDAGAGRLFVGGEEGTVWAVYLHSGEAVTRLHLASGIGMLAYDPELEQLYASLPGEGRVAVVETEKFGVLDSLETARECFSLTVDPKRGRLIAFLPDRRQAVWFEAREA